MQFEGPFSFVHTRLDDFPAHSPPTIITALEPYRSLESASVQLHVRQSTCVCVWALTYIHVRLFVCVSVRGHVCVCPWPCVCLSVAMCVSVRGHVCVCPWPCVCLSVAMCVSVCGHVCVCPWPCMCLRARLCMQCVSVVVIVNDKYSVVHTAVHPTCTCTYMYVHVHVHVRTCTYWLKNGLCTLRNIYCTYGETSGTYTRKLRT